jgi:hypothetical protein
MAAQIELSIVTRLEILSAALMKISVVCDVAPCNCRLNLVGVKAKTVEILNNNIWINSNDYAFLWNWKNRVERK